MENPLRPPADPGFRLIETFRWEPGKGVIHRDQHLARLEHSAARLGITPVGVETALATLHDEGPLRGRLTVDAQGCAEVTCAPFAPLPEGVVWRLAVSPERLRSDDVWLGVKTTQRALYDTARAALPEGVDEWLFLNERKELCEGTITNLFLRIDGRLITPPLSSGVLPGVLRSTLLEDGICVEGVVREGDLNRADEVFVGNSLRGLIRAVMV